MVSSIERFHCTRYLRLVCTQPSWPKDLLQFCCSLQSTVNCIIPHLCRSNVKHNQSRRRPPIHVTEVLQHVLATRMVEPGRSDGVGWVELFKESGIVRATIQDENGQGISRGQQVGEGDSCHLLHSWCLNRGRRQREVRTLVVEAHHSHTRQEGSSRWSLTWSSHRKLPVHMPVLH